MVEIVAVQQQGQQRAAVDSRALAEAMGNEHRATLQLIEKYETNFQALSLGFPLAFEMRVGTRGGDPVRFVNLNEPQCYFLLTLVRNTEKTVPMKQALIEKIMQAFELIRSRDQSAQAQALESAGRHELVMDAKFELLNKMAVQVVTAACVGQAYGGGKVKALYQLGVKNIHPLGYFTSVGKEVEVFPMLDVFQQFNAGMGPLAGRALLACEWEWTPYPVVKQFQFAG